jgi:hypothetical protein
MPPYFLQAPLEGNLALQNTSLGSHLSDLLEVLLQEVLHNWTKETLQELSKILDKLDENISEKKSWTGYLNQDREIKASQDRNLS